MRERTINPVLVNLQIPDYCSKQNDGGFYKKVTLLFNPGAIEVEHYRIARLVRIGNVRHKFRIDRIASVRPARIVEIYDIEPGLDLILVHILQQRIIGYGGQVIKLVIVDVNRKALGYKLAYVTVDYRIGLAATRCSDNHAGTENIDNIDKSVIPAFFIIESRREVYRIFILHQSGFLHETLIFHIEHIFHEVVPVKAAHP